MRRKDKISPVKNIIKTLPVLFGVLAIFYVAMLIKDIEVPDSPTPGCLSYLSVVAPSSLKNLLLKSGI